MLFGELNDGGRVEVTVSEDVVPKLLVEFKAKQDISEQFKPKEVSDEKTS